MKNIFEKRALGRNAHRINIRRLLTVGNNPFIFKEFGNYWDEIPECPQCGPFWTLGVVANTLKCPLTVWERKI